MEFTAIAETVHTSNIVTVVSISVYDGDDTRVEYGTLWIEHDPCDTDFPALARYASEDDAQYTRKDVPFQDGDLRPTVEDLVDQVVESREASWREHLRRMEAEREEYAGADA
jgi:hypothetical protein